MRLAVYLTACNICFGFGYLFVVSDSCFMVWKIVINDGFKPIDLVLYEEPTCVAMGGEVVFSHWGYVVQINFPRV